MSLDNIIVGAFILLAVAGLIYLQKQSQRKENETLLDREKIDSKK